MLGSRETTLRFLTRLWEMKHERLCLGIERTGNTKGMHHKSLQKKEEDGEEEEETIASIDINSNRLNDAALVSLLKTCANQKHLHKGSILHADIRRRGLLQKNIVLGNTLVNMFVKCGALANAQEVFDELPVQDVVSWTALISGYIQHGQGEEALSCFDRMQAEGISPDAMTFACILKACGRVGAAKKGKEVHTEVVKKGLLEEDSVLGNAVLDMYIKCHALANAQKVFNDLPYQSIVSWTMLILGFCQNGYGEEALKCYEQMQCEGLPPNALTFAFVLKACGSLGAVETGKEIHVEIAKAGLLGKDNMLGSALVDMYAKSGALARAQQMFDELAVRDKSSWTALIAGYCQHGLSEEALICFEKMQSERLSLDPLTLRCILQACVRVGAIDKGEKIHVEILREGLLGVLGNALVDMYAKCGALGKAHQVFEELPVLNVVSWTTLISGYAQYGHGEKALRCFEQMHREGVCPDAATFSCALKACGNTAAAEKGIEIHSEIGRRGMLGKNIVLENSLVDFYVKCGALVKAQEVFDEISIQDVVSWNVLIAGYAQHKHNEAALDCFEQMQREGLSPDEVTFSCIVKACANIGAAEKGHEIHAEMARKGLLRKNSLLGNGLVDMYARCGELGKAQEVFDELPVREVVSWTTLMEGYCLHKYNEQALSCFERMQGEGFSPNAVTLLCVLRTCSNIGAIEKGEEIFTEIVRKGLLEENSALGAALVDMYAKCGAIVKAQRVFDELSVRNVVSWTALMAGYAEAGKHDFVFESFSKMIGEGVEPNLVTFIIVLNACSHLGLVDEGQMHYETMRTRFGIIPNSEHQTCMVDLFSRAGHFDKAMSVIKKIPSSDCFPAWFTLLGACRKCGDVTHGRLAFEKVVWMDDKAVLAYDYMSTIYAAAGMQEDAGKIEAMKMKVAAGHHCLSDVHPVGNLDLENN